MFFYDSTIKTRHNDSSSFDSPVMTLRASTLSNRGCFVSYSLITYSLWTFRFFKMSEVGGGDEVGGVCRDRDD